MNTYLRIGLHAIYAFGLLLILAFSGSKYEWMAGVDPSFFPGAIEDGSGNRVVFLGLILAVIVATQLIVAINAKNTSEKRISVGLAITSTLVFVV